MYKRMVVLLALLSIPYMATLYRGLNAPLATDFTKFYASAVLFQEGTSIYAPLDQARFDSTPTADSGDIEIHPNLNPPLLTLLLVPLTWLPWNIAYVFWTLASLASGLAAMILLSRELSLANAQRGVLVSLIPFLLFYPTWATIRFGQLSLFLFFLIVLLWRDSRSGRDLRAGLILGFLMGLKLFTGLFLLFYLLQKRVKTVAVAILILAGNWGVSLIALGSGIASEYREALSQVTWTGASWNASLQGFFSRIFGGSEGLALWEAPQAGRILATLFSVLATLALVIAVRPREAKELAPTDLQFCLVLPLMLLLSPLGWMYYFPILLLPAAILWKRGKRYDSGLFFVLATLPFPFLEAAAVDGPLDWFVYSGVYFYALCWLAFAILKELRSSKSCRP